MEDLIYIGVAAAFFILSSLYVSGCDRLRE